MIQVSFGFCLHWLMIGHTCLQKSCRLPKTWLPAGVAFLSPSFAIAFLSCKRRVCLTDGERHATLALKHAKVVQRQHNAV